MRQRHETRHASPRTGGIMPKDDKSVCSQSARFSCQLGRDDFVRTESTDRTYNPPHNARGQVELSGSVRRYSHIADVCIRRPTRIRCDASTQKLQTPSRRPPRRVRDAAHFGHARGQLGDGDDGYKKRIIGLSECRVSSPRVSSCMRGVGIRSSIEFAHFALLHYLAHAMLIPKMYFALLLSTD